jgi:hypothetical protein
MLAALAQAAVRFALGLLLLCLGLPGCVQLLCLTIAAHPGEPQDPWAVAFGLGCGVALGAMMRPTWFFHTWMHENSHLLMCSLFWLRIDQFQASSGQGGAVVYEHVGPIRRTLIALAPYTLPLILLPLALARWLVPAGWWREGLSAAVACAAVHHLVAVFHNVRTNFWAGDGDLAVAGRFFSLVAIVEMLLLVAAGLVVVLWSGAPVHAVVK